MNYQDIVAIWQSKQIKTAADIACEMNGNGVAFIYHSAKIENDRITYHDTREIFDHGGVTGYTGDVRSLFEIQNSVAAYYRMLDAYIESLTLDRRYGPDRGPDTQKEREAASQSLNWVVQDYRKRFSSFKPTNAESYWSEVSRSSSWQKQPPPGAISRTNPVYRPGSGPRPPLWGLPFGMRASLFSSALPGISMTARL